MDMILWILAFIGATSIIIVICGIILWVLLNRKRGSIIAGPYLEEDEK